MKDAGNIVKTRPTDWEELFPKHKFGKDLNPDILRSLKTQQ